MNKHLLSTALAGGVLAATTLAAPAHAGGAVHEFYPEDYDSFDHFNAGEGPCVTWAGTMHEIRTGGYKLLQAPGGQVAGEFHVNGTIDGSVELIPDNTALPTYSGTYREKINGIIVAISADEDIERVGQYRLTSTLRGTDGSVLKLRLSGKVTVNANGRLVVSRDKFSCA